MLHHFYQYLDLNVPFVSLGWALLPEERCLFGTVRKVGQGQHMTGAHCYTILKSNCLSFFHYVSFCFCFSLFLTLSLSQTHAHRHVHTLKHAYRHTISYTLSFTHIHDMNFEANV